MLLTAIPLAAEAEHNVLLPAMPDLIWGTLSFVFLFLMFKKYAIPRATKMAEERVDKIEGGLRRAEAAQSEAAVLLKQYQEALAEARTEAAGIRNAAQAERMHIVEEARNEAVAAATEIAQRATQQLAAEQSQVLAGLQKEVGQIALDLAGRIVGEVLTDDARARATVERFIADLERAATEAGR
jgi:F-type H+-transporting ATPase subunit b